jgi:hypothetical protein
MISDTLDDLIKSGEISSYTYEEDDPEAEFRKTEKLLLNFPSGKKLLIETFCPGCSENTVLFLSDPSKK